VSVILSNAKDLGRDSSLRYAAFIYESFVKSGYSRIGIY